MNQQPPAPLPPPPPRTPRRVTPYGKGKGRMVSDSTRSLPLTQHQLSQPRKNNSVRVTVEICIPTDHISGCSSCGFDYEDLIKPMFPENFVSSKPFKIFSTFLLDRANKVHSCCQEQEKIKQSNEMLEDLFGILDTQNHGHLRQGGDDPTVATNPLFPY